jgi:hypothetical protein
MKLKSESFKCFKIFRSFFEKDGVHKIKALRTDNGGEYMSKEFESYLQESGIQHEPGPPHSPELNGVAERTNRTISNLIRTSLLSARLPKSFWADAMRHSFFAFDSFPCNTPLGFKTPASILGKPSVDLKALHPFGCLTYYTVPEANRKSLDKKGRASILLSYLPDGNGYRLWDLEKRTVLKSRDVIFKDSIFPYGSKLTTDPEPVMVEIPWPSLTNSDPQNKDNAGQDVPITTWLPTSLPITNSPLNSPPLEIKLAPRFDRCLTASIHAPGNAPRQPVAITSDLDTSSTPGCINSNPPSPISSPDLLVPIKLPPLPASERS